MYFCIKLNAFEIWATDALQGISILFLKLKDCDKKVYFNDLKIQNNLGTFG